MPPNRVDIALVEELLLYGSEGVELDFKRDQYPFEGATDLQKAELLKDILAFANAFRRNDAFILIGVEEVTGGRANVVGVTDHLKDADLQQFVNSKTNRNVVFSYHSIEVGGKQIGIIRIHDQQRPIFLKKDFGFDSSRNRYKLSENTVYFRVGSSTKEASPEDIARMGSHAVHKPVYDVDLQFANFRDKTAMGNVLNTTHKFISYNGEIPDYTSARYSNSPYAAAVLRSPLDNTDFWREAYNYILHWGSLFEVGFCIQNRGDTTIDDVTVEMAFVVSDRFMLVAEDDMPEKPEPQSNLRHLRASNLSHYTPDIRVEKRGDQMVVTLWFGKLQAGQRRFLPSALYLGNPTEKHCIIDAEIRADQFPSEMTGRLEFHTQGTVLSHEWEGLKKFIKNHLFGTEDGG